MERYRVVLNGAVHQVTVRRREGANITFEVGGESYQAEISSEPTGFNTNIAAVAGQSSRHSGEILAPIPGIVSEIAVADGASVIAGDLLFVIEAMKMENPVLAPISGKVKAIHVKKNEEVKKDAPLASLINEASTE